MTGRISGARWLSAAVVLASAASAAAQAPPSEVKFYGAPSSIISSGVIIPANRASIWVSGTTPALADPTAPAGSPKRFGDTRTQAASILETIGSQLATQGLTMKDVVYVRAYLVPDAANNAKIDVGGWNAAFAQVFGTGSNPTKPARSTVGVTALVNPDWLIEIEAFAVYPSSQ